MGTATAGLFVLIDVISLVEDSKHLHKGAKAESAAELRQQAHHLEQKLQELILVHDSLTQSHSLSTSHRRTNCQDAEHIQGLTKTQDGSSSVRSTTLLTTLTVHCQRSHCFLIGF
ncbi:apolipoprotein L3-like [Sigmodon hispidus]